MPQSASSVVKAFEFGQSEKLTTRLHQLVRNYPKGIGIIKEFLQNADDAGASLLRVIVDWQSYPDQRLPDPRMAALCGPALLIMNDAAFSEDDFRNIQEIGQSGKLRQGPKTGRFGLGFNASYNVADFPTLLTGDKIGIFDPHQSILPRDRAGQSGIGYTLDESLWQTYPDLLRPFQIAGLSEGAAFFRGTTFRLPLRTPVGAERSEIKKEAFTIEDFRQILEQLIVSGPELLIFLRNVQSLTVDEVDTSERGVQRLLSVTTLNESVVKEARYEINGLIQEDLSTLLPKLRAMKEVTRHVLYEHTFDVHSDRGKTSREETWLISSGLYTGPNGLLINAAEKMIRNEEKAIPLAGAAVRYSKREDGSRTIASLNGSIYCTLPLSEDFPLPVHINGFFDLNDSRDSLTTNTSLVGAKDRCRWQWNQLLMQHGVSAAYVSLVVHLAAELGASNPGAYYAVWPTIESQTAPIIRLLSTSVYSALADRPLIRTTLPDPWQLIGDVRLLSVTDPIYEPLVKDGMPIPDPALPAHIEKGFQAASVRLNSVTAKRVRDRLRVEENINQPIAEVSRQCLRKKKWIKELLRFCLQDKAPADLHGVPLLLLANGSLQAFGLTGEPQVFLAGPEERQIFKDHPEWFVDPGLAEHVALGPCEEIGITNMSPQDAVERLREYLDPEGKEECRNWKADAVRPPNAAWLSEVFEYLSSNAKGLDHGALKKLPLVPDQFRRLERGGLYETPLLSAPSDSGNKKLLKALGALKVSIVHGPENLIESIRRFAASVSGLIWSLNPNELIETLAQEDAGWRKETLTYDPEVHDVVLDFLTRPGWENTLEQGHFSQLRDLPLFPTESGSLMSPADEGVYLSTGFQPPPVLGSFQMLRVGRDGRWIGLLENLEAARCDRPTVIRQAIITGFVAMNRSQQEACLKWLRDNLSAAETDWEKNSPGRAQELHQIVSVAKLVWGTDGELHAAEELYDPRLELAGKILGTSAVNPDMTLYNPGENHWLRFFADLGMKHSLKAQDILRYVDILIKEATTNGVRTVADPLGRIYQHINENWNEFVGVVVKDADYDEEEAPFGETLATRSWLTAICDPERLARFPGYQVPEDRLYKPDELFLPRMGHLVASQRPLASLPKEPIREFRIALGFPPRPPSEDVIAHFDYLLKLWKEPFHSGLSVESLVQSLKQIYRHFGSMLPKDLRDVEVQEEDEGPDTPEGLDLLREHYAGVPCLWDPKQKSFRQPGHVFRASVPFFEPLRAHIVIKVPQEDTGYTALGRREEVAIEDCIGWLETLATGRDDAALDDDEVRKVEDVLFKLCLLVSPRELQGASIPVLTRSRKLRISSQVLHDDAPWYSERLASTSIEFLPERLVSLSTCIEFPKLSESVKESLHEDIIRSRNRDAMELSSDIERTLRSMQFRVGFARLCGYRTVGDVESAAGWLFNLSVHPANKIQTKLTVDVDGYYFDAGVVGTTYYMDELENCIYLCESQCDLGLFPNQTARAIAHRLSGTVNFETQYLVAILGKSPDQIATILDSLRVPNTLVGSISSDSMTRESAEIDAIDLGEQSEEDGVESSFTDGGHEAQVSREECKESGKSQSPIDERGEGNGELAPVEGEEHSPGNREDYTEGGRSWPAQRSSERHGTEGGLHGGLKTRSPDPGRRLPGEHTETGSKGTLLEPQEGRKRPGRGGKKHGQDRTMISYMRSPKTHDADEHDPEDDERPENMEIAAAALEFVLEEENRAGWNAEPMPHNNPGYDVLSTRRGTDERRYIEIKGIDGPWGRAGVPMTETQFRFNETQKDLFWLYVVEHARERRLRKLHRIHNPARSVTQFRFDLGWQTVATKDSPMPKYVDPAVGKHVLFPNGELREIIDVQRKGKFMRIETRMANDEARWDVFNPVTMITLNEEG